MTQVCPNCQESNGEYAEIDRIETFVRGTISITFWLCHGCGYVTALEPKSLDNISAQEFSRLSDYFKYREKNREYTLLQNHRRREISAKNYQPTPAEAPYV